MKQLVIASLSALALMGLAACSDSTDNATTQSTTPPPADQTQPATPQATPQTGTGGDTQQPPANDAMKPAEPAPAQ